MSRYGFKPLYRDKKGNNTVESSFGVLDYTEFSYNALTLLYPPGRDPAEFGQIKISGKEIQFKAPIIIPYNNLCRIYLLLRCKGRFTFQLGYYTIKGVKVLLNKLRTYNDIYIIYYTQNLIVVKYRFGNNSLLINIKYNSNYNLYFIDVTVINSESDYSDLRKTAEIPKILNRTLLHSCNEFTAEQMLAHIKQLKQFNMTIDESSQVEFQNSYIIGGFPSEPIIYIEKSLYECYKKSLKKEKIKNGK